LAVRGDAAGFVEVALDLAAAFETRVLAARAFFFGFGFFACLGRARVERARPFARAACLLAMRTPRSDVPQPSGGVKFAKLAASASQRVAATGARGLLAQDQIVLGSEVANQPYTSGAQHVANGGDDLAIVAGDFADRLHEFQQREALGPRRLFVSRDVCSAHIKHHPPWSGCTCRLRAQSHESRECL